MPIFHPTIFYIHMQTMWEMIKLQMTHFSWRRFLFTLTFVSAWIFVVILFTALRLIDELLFFGYRKTAINKPVFIIANPRSGTTYMHRLMCMDEDKFAYTLLYHTIFPSITFYKIVKLLGKIDRPMGRPMRKLMDRLDNVFFGGWKDVHPMGFNKSEEDEGLFTMTGISAGMYFMCPFIAPFEMLKFPDVLPEKQRKDLMLFYKNCLQRFMYAEGVDQIFLSKNVITTGRLKSLLSVFPDARIIYLVRNPLEAVPSFISMFSQPWKFHSPEIPDDSVERRELGQVAIDYYKYFFTAKDEIPKNQFLTLRYEDLVDNPKETVLKVYETFGLEITQEFKDKLDHLTKRNRTYASKHNYSLEQYGMNAGDLIEELDMIFSTYHFEHENV